MVMTRCHENESCSKVLNFLEKNQPYYNYIRRTCQSRHYYTVQTTGQKHPNLLLLRKSANYPCRPRRELARMVPIIIPFRGPAQIIHAIHSENQPELSPLSYRSENQPKLSMLSTQRTSQNCPHYHTVQRTSPHYPCYSLRELARIVPIIIPFKEPGKLSMPFTQRASQNCPHYHTVQRTRQIIHAVYSEN